MISLLPLTAEYHTAALQEVYAATPGYWAMYNLPGAPVGQAARDLQAVAETPGRVLLGMVRRLVADDASAGAELIGVLDLRLDWPAPETAYLGLVLVAEAVQRQHIGAQAWELLQPWLTTEAGMQRVRLGVEQFNPAALKFFEHLGFALTGEANRVKVGEKFVRLLYMKKTLIDS
jgi:RimJ/RimL family protein N-acetyltransferase